MYGEYEACMWFETCMEYEACVECGMLGVCVECEECVCVECEACCGV